MALIQLGDRTADWSTKARVSFDPVTVRKDRGVLFFLRTLPPVVSPRNQYLAVVATLSTSYGEYETPLECKYFPSGTGIMFVVAVPDADYARDVPITISVLPKEFKPGSATNQTLPLQLAYEDDLLRDVAVPIA